MLFTRIRSIAGAFACALLVAACGGGSSDSSPAAPAPGPAPAQLTTVDGTIDGFGSVVIDGTRYDDDGAEVARDLDPAAETPALASDLKVGMRVEATVDENGRIVRIVSRAAAYGKVQAVDAVAGTLQVAGQLVSVTNSTIYDGYASLAEIAVGDPIEVHGQLDPAQGIIATRISREDPTGGTRVRTSGPIEALDATAKTFVLGGLTIDYGSALLLPNGVTLANDLVVFVYADALPVAGKLTAKTVRVVRMPTVDGRRVAVGGLVSDFVSISDFKVNGFPVDASAASIEPSTATAADIKDLALVRVFGTISTSGATPVIKASRIVVVPAGEEREILLIGQVSDFVSTANFEVRGTPVDASGTEVVFSGGTAEDLANGTFVTVRGKVQGDKVVATRVEIRTPPASVPFRLYGAVSGYDAAAGTFKLLGIPMQLSASVVYRNGQAADFGNGKLVHVRGAWSGTAFVVTEVKFRPASLVPVVFTAGVSSEVTADSLKVDGQLAKITVDTKIMGGTLADGQFVDLLGYFENGELVATRIDVRAPQALARLQGPVFDFVSASDFTVNGTPVDASSATLDDDDSTLEDLANGVNVRVFGTLNAGKLVAVRLTILD